MNKINEYLCRWLSLALTCIGVDASVVEENVEDSDILGNKVPSPYNNYGGGQKKNQKNKKVEDNSNR